MTTHLEKQYKVLLKMNKDEEYIPSFKECPEAWDVYNDQPECYDRIGNKRSAFRSALEAYIYDLEDIG